MMAHKSVLQAPKSNTNQSCLVVLWAQSILEPTCLHQPTHRCVLVFEALQVPSPQPICLVLLRVPLTLGPLRRRRPKKSLRADPVPTTRLPGITARVLSPEPEEMPDSMGDLNDIPWHAVLQPAPARESDTLSSDGEQSQHDAMLLDEMLDLQDQCDQDLGNEHSLLRLRAMQHEVEEDEWGLELDYHHH